MDFKRDLSRLKIMAETADFNFDEATVEDLKDLVEEIQERNITRRTVLDYKKVLKRFYGWLNGGEHPEEVQWIKTTDRTKNNTLSVDVLTEDDVQELIDSTTSSRTEAFIALLWETGARIGEIMDLKVGDLRDHRHGLQIVIDGRTGQGRIPLISSIPQIRRWLNDHPAFTEKLQRCWSHLFREVEDVSDKYEEAVSIDGKLHEIYHHLNEFLEGDPPPPEREEEKRWGMGAMKELTEKDYEEEKVAKLVTYIENGMEYWFTFVVEPDVDPANNLVGLL